MTRAQVLWLLAAVAAGALIAFLFTVIMAGAHPEPECQLDGCLSGQVWQWIP